MSVNGDKLSRELLLPCQKTQICVSLSIALVMSIIYKEKRAARLLSGGDAAMILERMEQMYEELYRTYAEFEETKMELQERLKTLARLSTRRTLKRRTAR
jgi:hypothetical protein